MATSVIHPVVSTSAGRCSPCDPLTAPIPKTLSSGDKSSCSTTSCACLDCHKQSPNRLLPFHFYTHAQWTGSTVKGSCSNSIGGDGDGDGDNNSWPEEHKHRPLSAASLGILGAKKSPIFGRRLKQQKPSTLVPQEQEFFSLRSLAPIYTERKPQIDLSAVEAAATNMPGARTNMDINRNNGYLHNGTVMTPSNEKREHLYKILVIGELGTGKTSFIKRYVHQFFSQNYRATIGVDFALKVLHWDANTIVRLQLWDIAGQERFGNMTRVYYKEAVGAFIVFDVTRSGTFDCVSKWKEDLDSKVQLPDGSPIPCILLANKCDQDKQGIVTQPEKMDEYVRENGFAGWFETSAKENTNIDEAARALVNKILINDKLITAADLADAEKFNLNNPGDGSGTESKNKCSC